MFATTMGLTLIFLLFSPRATARAAGIAGIEVTIEPNITESLLLLPTTLEPPSTLDPDAFWLEAVRHQGKAAFNPNPESYQVFRNVKHFGARGDGVTDDTAAINAAISAGDRCGGGSCGSSTITPALVYFPQGTYVISSPIIAYYYSQLVGDPKNPPTLLASASFDGLAVIDADPYIPNGGGAQWYINQNNFFRAVRNFVIDVRQVPPEKTQGTGIHWQVSQATSLTNVRFEMSTASNSVHQGIWMENGSGGMMSDLVFNGGKFGIWAGNQQFTVRNITINDAQTAVFHAWNWGWTYQGVTINNCQVGFDLASREVGAIAVIDAVVNDTPVFVRSSEASTGVLRGSIVLNNARLNNVPTAVGIVGGQVVLPGGTTTIDSWVQGNVYSGTNPDGIYTQAASPATHKSSAVLDSAGRVFGRTRPQYENVPACEIVSIKSKGAKGDGTTDDTDIINSVLAENAGKNVVFFDAGTYIVTSTISVPPGTRMVGEAWTVISGKGSFFQNPNDPQVMIRVGTPGSTGVIEITDFVFSTVGPAGGAIVMEWNIHDPAGQQGAAGIWDTHIRLGGVSGTELEAQKCPRGSLNDECMAAFMGIHITSGATAYMEGTWVWTADHDLDYADRSQINIFSGRGILSESAGPVWLIGTAEHHTLYQYRLLNARDHYMGLIQTETPYYQSAPAAPAPFQLNEAYHDMFFPPAQTSAWALYIENSHNIFIFGAGLYSFFQNYTQDCIPNANCQYQSTNIDSRSTVDIFSLATVATAFQLSVDGRGIVDQSNNTNGFTSMLTHWSSESAY